MCDVERGVDFTIAIWLKGYGGMNGLEELRQKVRYRHGNLTVSVKRGSPLRFVSSEVLLQSDISDVKDLSLSNIVARVMVGVSSAVIPLHV